MMKNAREKERIKNKKRMKREMEKKLCLLPNKYKRNRKNLRIEALLIIQKIKIILQKIMIKVQ